MVNSVNDFVLDKRVLGAVGVDSALMLSDMIHVRDSFLFDFSIEKNDDWFCYSIDKCLQSTTLSKSRQINAIKKLVNSGIIDVSLKGLPASRFIRLLKFDINSLTFNLHGRSSGFIYLLKSNKSGYYKIGCTKDIESRIKSIKLQDNSCVVIYVHSSICGYFKKEKEIHNLFSCKRVYGEWFNLGDTDILTFKKYFDGKS